MIKIFKNIRKTLVNEGKTTSYLKYAIGEILLVVIGILIALQVNNWNEDRKESLQENQIIDNLRIEFEKISDSLKLDIENLEKSQNARLRILKLMNKTSQDLSLEQSWDSLLSRSISIPSIFPSSYILEELKNSGKIYRLKNNSVKTLLYKYDQQYSKILETITLSRSQYEYLLEYLKANAILRNIDATSPTYAGIGNSILKKNNLHLLEDLKFENAIDDVYALMYQRLLQYKRALIIINKIIETTNHT